MEVAWHEELPDDCPPADARPPDGRIGYYRLVKAYPALEDDFVSQRKLNPIKTYGVTECQARALSVFTDIADCENARKVPANKNNKIARMHLTGDAGKVVGTASRTRRSHCSWWRAKDYDPIPNAELVTGTTI